MSSTDSRKLPVNVFNCFPDHSDADDLSEAPAIAPATNGSGPALELAIPLIDISPLQSPSLESRRACAAAILNAFSRSGFLYLSQHPIAAHSIATVFSHSAAFFARPAAEKERLAWTSAAANRGYVRQGREKVSVGQTSTEVAADRLHGGEDLKESMEIGRDDEASHPNHWPDTLDASGAHFRSVMTAFFTECKALHCVLMRAIALGLGLDEAYFDAYVQTGDNTLRLLHYPAVDPQVFRQRPGQVRAGAHSDYGSITLLFQDERGGLEVMAGGAGGGVGGAAAAGEQERWLPVPPVLGTVVVNAGDLLALWSSGRIRSTMHRVVEPPGPPPPPPRGDGLPEEAEAAGGTKDPPPSEHPARYSVAYFCNPDFDKWIEAIPGTEVEGNTFQGCYSGEYLERRLGATYG